MIAAHQTMLAPPALPYDAEVEWLSGQSNGRPAAYIETGINSGDTVGFEVEVTRVNEITGDIVVFGTRKTSGDTRWFVGAQSGGKYYWGWNGRIDSQPLNLNDKHTLGLNFRNSRTATFDGVSVGSLSGAYSYEEPLYFPAYNNVSVGEAPSGSSSWRVHAGRISVGSTIVHDYTPVRVGSVGAWYDRVSRTLFKNDGLVPFVVGPDKT